LKQIFNINKVTELGQANDLIFIGISHDGPYGTMVTSSDEISIYQNGQEIDSIKFRFNKFLSFSDGVIFRLKDDRPIDYFNFKTKEIKTITRNNFYFNPLQLRSNINHCYIVESDKEYNQIFYLLNKEFEMILLPTQVRILLENYYIHYKRNLVEVYSLDDLRLIWRLGVDAENEVENQNQIDTVFSDGKMVFVHWNNGNLFCYSLNEGEKIWEWQSAIKEVYFSEINENIYVHFGVGFHEIDKLTGNLTRTLSFNEINGLENFRSYGFIWCFDDVIVTVNSFKGEMAIFDRYTFDLLGREKVDPMGIPQSKDCIRYVDGFLYVLATSSIAYIYQITPQPV